MYSGTERAVACPNYLEAAPAVASAFPWYAIRTKSNFSERVAVSLRDKGYDEYYPRYAVRQNWSDRVKTVFRPLFPGYVFCRFDVSKRLPILTTPGVIEIIGTGRLPVAIPDAEIEAIQRILQTGLQAEPWPYLKPGDEVSIETGPLTGVRGRLLATKGTARLVVSITMLQRSVAVELDRWWVQPLDSAAAHPAAL